MAADNQAVPEFWHMPPDPIHGLALIAAFVMGGLVGLSELLSRYKSDPVGVLKLTPGVLYIAINALASLFALLLIGMMGWRIGSGTADQILITQTLAAAFGSLAFFRTSFFTVRIGNSDVQVGPAAFLQVILASADRMCDRLLARPRAAAVAEIMSGVAFTQAKQALPALCFNLMQNVSEEEQQSFAGVVEGIDRSAMVDSIKSDNLGLSLMNLVGVAVLRQAVSIFRQSSGVPAPAPSIPPQPIELGLETLGLLSRLTFEGSAWQIAEQCRIYVGQWRPPGQRVPRLSRLYRGWRWFWPAADEDSDPVVDAIARMKLPDEQKLKNLARVLSALYGEAVVQKALQVLPENVALNAKPPVPV